MCTLQYISSFDQNNTAFCTHIVCRNISLFIMQFSNLEIQNNIDTLIKDIDKSYDTSIKHAWINLGCNIHSENDISYLSSGFAAFAPI